MALSVNDNVTYFDNFRDKQNSKRNLKNHRKLKFVAHICKVQAYDSIISIGFIDFRFKGKSLCNYTNLFLQMIMKKKMTNQN